MKKIWALILTGLILASLTTGTFAASNEAKIGYVDLSLLFDEYHKTKIFDGVLEAQHKEFEKERDARIEEIKEAQGKLGLLTEDKRAPLEEEIEKKKADLLEYDRQKKTDLTKERNEKIREILLEIEKLVSEYAKKEGYSVILNDRVLIYGNEEIDLTSIMLEKLNANQPSETKSNK